MTSEKADLTSPLLEASAPASTPALLGSPPFLAWLEGLARRLKNSGNALLLTGETGTGKTTVARYLYNESSVYKRCLRVIPLGEIPESLFEAEMFGYGRGSFTGAVSRFEGKLQGASGGTLLLEDVDTLPPHLQAKMLRVIEERRFERVGCADAVEIDARVVATSNADLRGLVRSGQFRADLFFRLNVVTIDLLPLRERAEDIALLADQFLRRAARDQRKSLTKISSLALKALTAYSWPGNVRELRSEMERAVSLADARTRRLSVQRLSPAVLSDSSSGLRAPKKLADQVRRAEAGAIVACLLRNGGKRGVTATELGISRRTLYNKIRELGIRIQGL